MATKYYAVKRGRNPGIYTDVKEYRAQVDGFTGYKAHAFKTRELAHDWLYGPGEGRFYAVRIGRTPGIYTDVNEYKAQVDGFTLAVSKKFKSFDEAHQWVSKKTKKKPEKIFQLADKAQASLAAKQEQAIKINTEGMIAYVDGSFNHETNRYSYGVVILHNNEEKLLYGSDNRSDMIEMCNVAGEITGAIEAMKYASEHNAPKITIVHDFNGIASLCVNECKANSIGTKEYRDFYQRIIENIVVEFQKVKGHSDDYYNDLADALAKKAAGVRIKKPVAKRLAVVGEM
jgi:ribonuclease HI